MNPPIINTWVSLAQQHLNEAFPARQARWHRAKHWRSLQLDGSEPYVLFVCDNGQLHINWTGTRDRLLAIHRSLIAAARRAPPDHPYRWILDMHDGAATDLDAPAFIDKILTRSGGFTIARDLGVIR